MDRQIDRYRYKYIEIYKCINVHITHVRAYIHTYAQAYILYCLSVFTYISSYLSIYRYKLPNKLYLRTIPSNETTLKEKYCKQKKSNHDEANPQQAIKPFQILNLL